MKNEIYSEAVEKIITSIQSGVKPWVRPFDRPNLGRARNFFTKIPYQGVNSMLLMMDAYRRGYASNNWLTFKQLSLLKGKVKKGESATRIFFFTYVGDKNADKDALDSSEVQLFPRWKYFNVFNLDQTEGVIESKTVRPHEHFERNRSVDEVIVASGATIKNTDRKTAFYSPVGDFIHLPYQNHFHTVGGYYATVLHELVHWTGHSKRLDRMKPNSRYGDKAYAFEELVAELGAAFLSTDLNVNGELENHAAYLNDWASLLNDKHMAFFRAASYAEKATQYLYALVDQQSVVLPFTEPMILLKAA